MIVNSKGTDFNIDVYVEDERFYRAFARNECDEIMGYIIFKAHEKYSWLYKIETYDEFQNRGVGKALLTTMEYILLSTTNCYNVEGKFYPTNSRALPFYNNNGYTIYKDGYEHYVSKYLSKKDLPNVTANIKSPLELKPWMPKNEQMLIR